ncbi:MAG: BamA/TamA family outer membrane protein [Bacteroidota bacterium]
MLRKNKVVIVDRDNVSNFKSLRYTLESSTYQKPNNRFLGLISTGPWYYYRVKAKKDTTKWTRFVLKNLAEEPAIHRTTLANESAKNMEGIMISRGYLDASVEFEAKRKGRRQKKTIVTYNVTAGERYYIDTINFISKDTAIHRILQEIKPEAILKRGSPVDYSLHDQEKRRITNHLKNIGYANFYMSYMTPLRGDSIGHKVNVDLEVLLTKGALPHRKFSIGEVAVISLFDENGDPVAQRDTLLNGKRFYLGKEGKHYIKLKTLAREIFIKEGDLYKINNIDKTKVQLGNLDLFQFVDVRRKYLSPSDTAINYEIRLIPKKRQQIGVDFEFNNSRTAATSNAFLGTAVSLNYKNRNFFRGGEVFNAQAEGGLEIVPRGFGVDEFRVNAWNVNLSARMDFPRYFDMYKTDWFWRKTLLRNHQKFYSRLREEGVSTSSLRYNILANTGSYRIDIFAGSVGWRFKPTNRLTLTVNKVGLDFLDPVFDKDFETTFVASNPYLERSLKPQLFTAFGLIFRDFNFLYRKDSRFGGKYSWYARANLEISGLEIYGINKIRNSFSSNDITFRLLDKFEFSQYANLEIDLRGYRKFSGDRMLAGRFNAGMASSFGFSDEVPFVKQFFVGGPTSMRAWRIRELGPGSYEDNTVSINNNFFQTGDVKLEMNLEYRFHLFYYFKGAIFLDAGNIWSLREDPVDGRAGADLSNFFDEIAVGTGIGLRLDVDYFVIRSDFGYKLRSPFPDDLGNQWLVNSRSDLALNKFVWQLAVGYPF